MELLEKFIYTVGTLLGVGAVCGGLVASVYAARLKKQEKKFLNALESGRPEQK